MSDPDEITTKVTNIDETGEAIDARQTVLNFARAELGQEDPDKYWAVVQPRLMGHPHTVAWCGGFALWCLRQAKICDFEWTIGSGFLYRLQVTHNPLPGDIAYFQGLQHHAVVELVENGVLHSIDGNTMAYPAEGVTSKTRPANAPTEYYSIATLIGETP